ncbi:hypothetical protein ACFE04_015959 [Oxalis oulophora]
MHREIKDFEICLKDVIARYNLHSNNIEKLNQPTLELQLENSSHIRLSKEVADKTHELRQLRGEELQGLNIEDLQRLEKILETGLTRVMETKGERIVNEISALERKGALLLEENKKLKDKMVNFGKVRRGMVLESDVAIQEEGVSSVESFTNGCSCSSGPPLEDDSSDTSLKLGLASPFLKLNARVSMLVAELIKLNPCVLFLGAITVFRNT